MRPETTPQDAKSPAGEARPVPVAGIGGLIWGFGLLAGVLLVAYSVVAGRHLWLTGINLVVVYGGLFALLTGHRKGNERMVRAARIAPAVTSALCIVVVAVFR